MYGLLVSLDSDDFSSCDVLAELGTGEDDGQAFLLDLDIPLFYRRQYP